MSGYPASGNYFKVSATNRRRKFGLALQGWKYYIPITLPAQPAGDDLPVLIYEDNSIYNVISDHIWSNVLASGADIAVTTDSAPGTKLPREQVSIDTVNKKMELWFKRTSSTKYRLWYGKSDAAESNSENTWNSNFKMVQHLKSGLLDSTPNNNDGTASNAIESDGKIGKCYSFNNNGSIAIGQAASLNELSNTFSIVLWLNDAAQASLNHGVVVKRSASGAFYAITLETYTAEANKLKVRINDGTNNIQPQYILPNVSTWKQIVIVVNGRTSTSLKVYANNVELSTTGAGMESIGSLANNNNLNLGFDAANNSYLTGKLDEVWIIGAALTVSQISAIYNNQNNPAGFYTVRSEVRA